ncbi:5-methyltetrahydropteroyltriglutamate--homocysteine methyltransferase [Acrasis kona]|uniref:5-methyltetrahydropteroyltriglutamate--homocysteine S-methyltransferase n=1 Tax=Acrasis kona TaxID=1008807 RepID=A0AAW2ZGV8_9EUKA
MSVKASSLGFPRIGSTRQVKKSVESFWSGALTEKELLEQTSQVRTGNWKTQAEQGLDIVPVGDFTLYDHVLDHSFMFNVIPKRYEGFDLTAVEQYFAMGRGLQRPAKGEKPAVDVPASEMKKWFDSNYHYIVPEFSPETNFTLNTTKTVDEYVEAAKEGIPARPVLLGPVSFLLLGKAARDAPEGFQPISLLPKLLPVYKSLLNKLADAGAKWVQIDEPVLVLDKTTDSASDYQTAFDALHDDRINILLATYFGRLESNINYVKNLNIQALHIDLVRVPEQLQQVAEAIKDKNIILSLGVVDGRNIWKNDFESSIKIVNKAIEILGSADRVQVSSSSSLLHVPHTVVNEKKLSDQVKDWFSFAVEKCAEISVIAKSINNLDSVKQQLEQNAKSINARREFTKNSNDAVRKRVAEVTPDMYKRQSPFVERRTKQNLNLPKFPTTTIGSFPQTKEIRVARQRLGKSEITETEYTEFIKKEIEGCIRFQERVGLDLLVHGECERNDMVQYFGELLDGFAFTQNGWVASYGSRYVKPPIIVSDVSRPFAMTVKWSSYAQTLTSKPVKGMLTGPVTILNWSFPREDVSREISSRQLALALRDEVVDLEKAGIRAIQVDEPALREGLPLRRADWQEYLNWAVDSFRLATAGVTDSTQTHSHFCYSDFNDIFESIKKLDADVITIENSKSDSKLLKVFETQSYTNEIGPGVYDIHSPRVPSEEEIYARIKEMLQYIPAHLLHVNPDCGLKTRQWKETEASLVNLVNAARRARAEFAQ